MVDNKYPDLKPTTFTWHPATESPGKRQVLMAFTRKDLKEGQYVFEAGRFLSSNVRPAECEFHDSEGHKQLPVAWKDLDDERRQMVADHIAKMRVEHADRLKRIHEHTDENGNYKA